MRGWERLRWPPEPHGKRGVKILKRKSKGRRVEAVIVLEAVLTIERNHRTPGSYDYQNCAADPCVWCLFIREWGAYKTVELGLERDIPTPSRYDDVGRICEACAYEKGRDPVEDSTGRGVCNTCRLERVLYNWEGMA